MITEEIRAARRRGLGGSDIAGILGLSPWATPVTVWLDKTGRAPEKSESEAMWWGSEEEILVARRFTELTGKRTVNHNFMAQQGCLLANFDRLIIPEGQKIAAYHGEIRTSELLECKTSGREWDNADVVEILPNGYEVLDGESGVPEYYQTQCYHYMGRAPSSKCIYVAVKMSIPCRGFSRTKFAIYRLNRDDAVIRAQDEFATNWWDEYVVGGKIPEATSDEEASLIWKRSTPKTSVVVDSKMLRAYMDLKKAHETIESAEKDAEKAVTDIKNYMKDAESILGTDNKTILATWKSGKDKETVVTDWNAVAAELATYAPDGLLDQIAAKHTARSVKPGSRSFRAKMTDDVASAVKEMMASTETQEDFNGATPQDPSTLVA